MNRIEPIILRSLLYNESYTRRVLPYVSDKYFGDKLERTIFTKIHQFVEKYKNIPSKEAIIINLDDEGLDENEFKLATEYLDELETSKEEKTPEDWLLETTESWCQEKAIHNAVLDVINILNDKDSKKPKGGIPKLLQDALAISFDPSVGHDYLEDADARFEYYHKSETRIPFHLDWFNKVTNGGIPTKTLNIILAGTNVGKSLVLCDFSANYLAAGKNVLYITMEMAEERIAERIDANLMNVSLQDLPMMLKPAYVSKINSIKNKVKGRLVIKEFPTAQAHSGHFRALINELALKKKFKPDVLFIDYLNIVASSRVRLDQGGTYGLVKAIAEELRGLGVEFKIPVWSATQTTRTGFGSSDVELTDTSESFALPATTDFMFALMTDETLAAQNQFLVKILKNRYMDSYANRKFLIGVDRSKMKLFDLEDDSEQKKLSDANHTSSTEEEAPFDLGEAVAAAAAARSEKPTVQKKSVFKGGAKEQPKKVLKV